MALRIMLFLLSALMCMPAGAGKKRKMKLHIEQLVGHPAAEPGIEKGVSACFAGLIDGRLVMAGGCNFPEKPAAEKGSKRYYKGIYVATAAGSGPKEWRLAGYLPAAAAYGVSVVCGDKLYCIGGNNAEGGLNTVWAIRLEGGQAVVDTLPGLPACIDNMAGCALADSIVVLGGNWDGTPSRRAVQFCLSAPADGWQPLPDMPGLVRVQPVCTATGRTVRVWGGFAPKTETEDARLGIDGLQYDLDTRCWTTLPQPVSPRGEPVFLGGGCAVSLSDGSTVAMGGVNKDVFLTAVNHPQPGYMTHPVEWYRFNRLVLRYADGAWHTLGESEATARAGAALLTDGTTVYEIGGELKPGVRSTGIYRLRITLSTCCHEK